MPLRHLILLKFKATVTAPEIQRIEAVRAAYLLRPDHQAVVEQRKSALGDVLVVDYAV